MVIEFRGVPIEIDGPADVAVEGDRLVIRVKRPEPQIEQVQVSEDEAIRKIRELAEQFAREREDERRRSGRVIPFPAPTPSPWSTPWTAPYTVPNFIPSPRPWPHHGTFEIWCSSDSKFPQR